MTFAASTRVLALRRLGLGLDAIAIWLATEAEAGLLNLVRQHLAAVDEGLQRRKWLRDRLTYLIEFIEQTAHASTELIVGILEVMDMYDDYLTAEQQGRLDRERRELGFPGMDQWRAEAGSAVSALRAAFDRGAEPNDPQVQDLVRRIRDLRRQFVGHDPAFSRALRAVHGDPMWDDFRAVVPQDPDLRAFWKRARDARSA